MKAVKLMLQQNTPVLNWSRRLTQIVLCNSHNMVVVVVVVAVAAAAAAVYN